MFMNKHEVIYCSKQVRAHDRTMSSPARTGTPVVAKCVKSAKNYFKVNREGSLHHHHHHHHLEHL